MYRRRFSSAMRRNSFPTSSPILRRCGSFDVRSLNSLNHNPTVAWYNRIGDQRELEGSMRGKTRGFYRASIAGVALLLTLNHYGLAIPILGSDIVVERVNGTTSASTAVLVDEYA